MKKIALTQGKFALCDDEDFEWLNQYFWSFDRYAVRGTNSRGKFYMHREVSKAKINQEIDHINGNKLDNRKFNLRITNRNGNMQNRNLLKTNKSGYKGVSFENQTKKWKVQICIHSHNMNLGRFATKKKAAKVYDEAAKKYFGEFARLNNL